MTGEKTDFKNLIPFKSIPLRTNVFHNNNFVKNPAHMNITFFLS